MLRELAVQNLALIEDVRVELQPGFCAWTGETGAGKSLLLGALGMLLGDRGSADLIRTGADELRKRFLTLDADRQRRQRELSLVRFEREELDGAALEPGELEDLRRERERLVNAQSLQELASRGYAVLYEDEGAVIEQLGKIQ